MKIRKYRLKDKKAVKEICADTGFLGEPIEKVMDERRFFSYISTAYYLEYEPESCFVMEDKGKVVGYLLGCKDSRREQRFFKLVALKTAGKMIKKYLSAKYNASTRKIIKWLVFHKKVEEPRAPRHYGHLHINLLKPYRNKTNGTKLMKAFFKYLINNNIPGVYAQTFDYKGAKAIKFFKKLGFKEYDRVINNMWKGHVKGPVYLVTLVKTL